jgi:putative Holliday junction resolvase
MRLMGLDIGSQIIGVAISDELGFTAQGLKTIQRKIRGEELDELAAIISQFGISRVVVGLPKNMNGTLGKQAEIVLRWIETFQKKIPINVVTWDERLSTVGASKVLLEANVSRKKRKKVIDKLAAVLILQGYLDQSRISTDGTFSPT